MFITERWGKLLTALNVAALAIIFFYVAKELAIPFAAEALYRDRYKELVFQCDNVMRDHFIAKNQVLTAPSPGSFNQLRAAEVGLLTCHDYDVLRKKLIALGLSDNRLAQMGLEAIEERAKDVRTFVETHEIRY
ncbi:MAG: hypothetical protein HY348_06035 [Nitrospira defluvii]|nr:hypothetical protein [Nitrospira defluvii]